MQIRQDERNGRGPAVLNVQVSWQQQGSFPVRHHHMQRWGGNGRSCILSLALKAQLHNFFSIVYRLHTLYCSLWTHYGCTCTQCTLNCCVKYWGLCFCSIALFDDFSVNGCISDAKGRWHLIYVMFNAMCIMRNLYK